MSLLYTTIFYYFQNLIRCITYRPKLEKYIYVQPTFLILFLFYFIFSSVVLICISVRATVLFSFWKIVYCVCMFKRAVVGAFFGLANR